MLLISVLFNLSTELLSTVDANSNNSNSFKRLIFLSFSIERILQSLYRYILHENYYANKAFKNSCADNCDYKQNLLCSEIRNYNMQNKQNNGNLTKSETQYTEQLRDLIQFCKKNLLYNIYIVAVSNAVVISVYSLYSTKTNQQYLETLVLTITNQT